MVTSRATALFDCHGGSRLNKITIGLPRFQRHKLMPVHRVAISSSHASAEVKYRGVSPLICNRWFRKMLVENRANIKYLPYLNSTLR